MSVAAVARLLGGKKVLRRELRSESDLIAAVRKGLPVAALDSVFEACADTVNTRSDLYQAVGNMRTLQRKRTEHSALSPDESDRLARLARLLVRAEDAFGDRAKAHQWMATTNRALGGERPLSLLDSDTGALEVERVLGRIEHGVYS
jgi:putative toxin-antitoxin system antitoxin component (TIGR02293 family)